MDKALFSWSNDLLLKRALPLRSSMFLVSKTSQELRMLSTVTLDCQVTKIVMNSDSQL